MDPLGINSLRNPFKRTEDILKSSESISPMVSKNSSNKHYRQQKQKLFKYLKVEAERLLFEISKYIRPLPSFFFLKHSIDRKCVNSKIHTSLNLL